MLEEINPAAVRLAIDDMESTFPGRYDGAANRQRLADFERDRKAMMASLAAGGEG